MVAERGRETDRHVGEDGDAGGYAVKAVSGTKKIYDGILPLMDENLVQLTDTSKSTNTQIGLFDPVDDYTTMQPMELESEKPTSTAKGVLHLGGEDGHFSRENSTFHRVGYGKKSISNSMKRVVSKYPFR